MINVLALDLGSKTGWALQEQGRIESGVQVFDVKRGESPGMRYVRFRRWLNELAFVTSAPLSAWTLDLIVFEQAHHRGGAATEVAAGLSTRVQEFCAERGIEHAAVHSATLKKFVTGSGRGDKADMLAHAMKRGWIDGETWLPQTRLKDDNEVDAVCLLHYALAELVPRSAEGGAPSRSGTP